MKTPGPSSERIVQARHRAGRLIPALRVMAGGLAGVLAVLWLAHPTFAPVENWRALGPGWLLGILATLGGAILFSRWRKRSLLHSAAELDAALATDNRLETATALRQKHDALARAQREETEFFLQRSQVAAGPRRLVSLGTLTAILALAHLVTLACWARSLAPETAGAKETPKAATVVTPTASLEWKSPETEATATAIEEVPLEVEADSTTGLRQVALHIAVNGQSRLTQPLTNNLSAPGPHSLPLALYLDQLEVKAYDMVSYHLTAQRIAPGQLPPTVSAVQFVQIKPLREDTFICAGGDQPGKCFNYVTALKAAQLRLMKENFTLANAEVSRTSAEWQEENSRVGTNQADLAQRTGEVMELMATNHYPAEILGLVRQSQPLMTEAGGKIVRQQNQPALAPQGQALGYLTEVERYLKHSIKLASHGGRPKANDPFQKPKNLELKTHPLTRAGKVDALAKEQSGLAGDLASGNTNSVLKLPSDDAKSDAPPIAGTPGERQSEIKRRIGELLEDPGFETDALKHLQSSDDLAGQAQQNIADQNFAAASEPAAAAARELRQTAAALRAGGDQAAKNALADALLQLASAAQNVRKAGQTKSASEAEAELKKSEAAVQAAAKQLEAEAQQQEASGGKNAAERLREMAKLLNGAGLKQMQAQARQSPQPAGANEALAQKLDEMVARAAQMRNQGQPSRQELARLIERMQRTQANFKNFASQCNSPGAATSGMAAGSGAQPGQQPAPASSGSQPGATLAADGVTRARSAAPERAEQLEQFGQHLRQELREQIVDAMGMKPDAPQLRQLRELMVAAAELKPGGGAAAAFVAELDPPLTGLITMLRQELKQFRRQHQLADPQLAQAPREYRPAVADYFEQLSRDYAKETAPPEASRQ